ncbi:MAG TPA: hypothetical protein VIF62_10560 [Labilithrix sp.]|jgi:hypothetical protein
MRPLAIAIASLVLAACSSAPVGGVDYTKAPPARGGDDSATGDDAGATDPGAGDDTSATVNPPPPPVADSGTTAPPCDPMNPSMGTKLLVDALDADRGLLAAIPGFPSASWSYSSGALHQTRLADAADATWISHDVSVDAVDVTVTAASTEISNSITPVLRQMFVLVGATVTGTTMHAYGCGAEVVDGLSPTQRTSVVELSGSAGSVTTTAMTRTARQALQVNETFTIHAHLAPGGALTCTLTQAEGTTTASATIAGGAKGSVGLFTRQTKSSFATAKFCAL